VLVGDDPASHVYVRNKRRTAEKVGIDVVPSRARRRRLAGRTSSLLDELSADPSVHGILLQFPLPGDLDGEAAVLHIDPAKDADGLHPVNLGNLILDRPGPRPCTPSGACASSTTTASRPREPTWWWSVDPSWWDGRWR
jgi:methylenetetrahydrofolate dehydrogenase (NADP+) / methenyltetrahydrofolate cyclohydrolase